MKFNQLIIFASTLMLSVSCARDAAVNQPTAEAVSPSPASPAGATTSTDSMTSVPDTAGKSGTFVPGEAPTEGTVQVVMKDGKRYLELGKTFKTSDRGPDLFVILHRSDNVLGSTKPPAYPLQKQDYVILGPLQKTSGTQQYLIPETVNLKNYKSAAIWCRQFNATFGVAKFDS